MIDLLQELWLEIVASLIVAGLLVLAKTNWDELLTWLYRLMVPAVKRSGYKMIYPSAFHAQKSIKESVMTTGEVNIISVKGGEWIGTDHALLSDLIRDKDKSRLKLKILLLSPDSYWWDYWATKIGRPPEKLQNTLEETIATHKHIKIFVDNLSSDSQIKYYDCAPIWRMVLTDDRVFVASYEKTSQVRDNVVIEYEDGQCGEEVYKIFKRYFDDLWKHASLIQGVE